MPRYNTYTLAATHQPAAAAATTRVDIPRSGFITHIDHMLSVAFTSAAAAVEDDGLASFIQAARINAAGSKTFFNVTSGRQWFWWNYFRYLGAIQNDTPAIPAGGVVAAIPLKMAFPLHLGFDPLNLYDAKVVIPARDVQNLVEEIVWGSLANIQAGSTVTYGANTNLSLTLNEIALEPGETVQQYFPAGFLLPRFEARRSLVAAATANLGVEDDVPVGDQLFQTLVLLEAALIGGLAVQFPRQHDSPNTSVAAMHPFSEVGVKFPKVRETPMQVRTDHLSAQMRMLYSLPANDPCHIPLPSAAAGYTLPNADAAIGATAILSCDTNRNPRGAFLLNWERISRSPFGLDLKVAQAGDVKLCVTSLLGTGAWTRLHYALG